MHFVLIALTSLWILSMPFNYALYLGFFIKEYPTIHEFYIDRNKAIKFALITGFIGLLALYLTTEFKHGFLWKWKK